MPMGSSCRMKDQKFQMGSLDAYFEGVHVIYHKTADKLKIILTNM